MRTKKKESFKACQTPRKSPELNVYPRTKATVKICLIRIFACFYPFAYFFHSLEFPLHNTHKKKIFHLLVNGSGWKQGRNQGKKYSCCLFFQSTTISIIDLIHVQFNWITQFLYFSDVTSWKCCFGRNYLLTESWSQFGN